MPGRIALCRSIMHLSAAAGRGESSGRWWMFVGRIHRSGQVQDHPGSFVHAVGWVSWQRHQRGGVNLVGCFRFWVPCDTVGDAD
jgi:hypothetical protein